MNRVSSKLCRGCNRDLPLSAFGSCWNAADKLQYRCRFCFQDYRKAVNARIEARRAKAVSA